MHKPSLASLVIALIPLVAVCFTVGLWDRVFPLVFGLPFNMFWLVLWIFLTPCIMSFAYKIEVKKINEENARKEGEKA
jgi:ABC-type uncharacterized transport system fused permease/ATPase subunit